MPICSSGTQCPLYSAASLGLYVIGPHANPPSHIILTAAEMPLRRDEKSGKVGRNFRIFNFEGKMMNLSSGHVDFVFTML